MLATTPDTGGGGAGGATLVVAAADAADSTKATADFVCDGVNDEDEWNAAIAALPTAGGLIRASEGLFHLGAPIVVNRESVTIAGVGWNFSYVDGTAFTRDVIDDYHAFEITDDTVFIQDLGIWDDGSFANASELMLCTHGVNLRNVVMENDQSDGGAIRLTGPLTATDCDIEGDVAAVLLVGSAGIFADHSFFYAWGTGPAIDTDATFTSGQFVIVDCVIDGGIRIVKTGLFASNVSIRDCRITASDVHSIHLDGPLTAYVQNNSIRCGDGAGIYLANLANGADGQGLITGNTITQTGRQGIFLLDSSACLIEGNRLDYYSYPEDDGYSGICLTGDCNENTIIGNRLRSIYGLYGIEIIDSTCDDNFVTNNDLKDSSKSGGTGGPLGDGGTGTVTTAGNRT
jgi:parallel beta-helix repeat protein